MRLDPQTQGDARTKKHADVCNGYLPTELADEEARKRGCTEGCDCWCHFTFPSPGGSDRDDAEALRAEIRRVKFGESGHPRDEKARAAKLIYTNALMGLEGVKKMTPPAVVILHSIAILVGFVWGCGMNCPARGWVYALP
jgi:hypothetical protein